MLVHGLLQAPQSLMMIKTILSKDYPVYYFSYPSTKASIENNADSLYRYLVNLSHQYEVIHLVGHSLGGVIICEAAKQHDIQFLGRIVLIASPVKGSAKARFFKRYAFIRMLYGPAVEELGDDDFSSGINFADDSLEVGVITAYLNKLFGSPFVPGIDDGVVAETETTVPNAKDRISLYGQHTMVLLRSKTAREVASFIQTGRFAQEN